MAVARGDEGDKREEERHVHGMEESKGRGDHHGYGHALER
jgi:N6-adenosine-specific RNA methylase IME4